MDKILQSGQILTDKLYHDILNSLSTFGRDPVVVVSQPGGVEKPLNVLPVLSPGSSHSQSPLRPDDRQSEFWAEAWPERIFATEPLPCCEHHLSPGEASGRLHPGYQSSADLHRVQSSKGRDK